MKEFREMKDMTDNKVRRPEVSKNLDRDKRTTLNKVGLALLALLGIGALVAGIVFTRGDISYKKELEEVNLSAIQDLQTEIVDANTYKFTKNADAPVLEIYEDFACPVCRSLELTQGGDFTQAVDEGKLTLVVHEVDILSPINAEYSTDIIGLIHEAAKVSPEKIYNLREWLYYNQPQEGFSLTEDQLKTGLLEVGYTEEEANTIISANNEVSEDVKNASKESQDKMLEVSGKVGTPTLVHEDKLVDRSNTNWLTDITG